MPIACDVTILKTWELKAVRLFLEGKASAEELIYFLQTNSDNIPVVECLLLLGGT